MAKRYKKSSSKCPEPINTMLDLLGAAALGAYTKNKIKRDYAKGKGEESIKAASLVMGPGAFRRGSKGIINTGGLIGLNSAIKDIHKQEAQAIHNQRYRRTYNQPVKERKTVRKYAWRDYCEDGSSYGVSPFDYETADEYSDALKDAKEATSKKGETIAETVVKEQLERKVATKSKRHVWRKYCTDGSMYGINPDDFETADEYEEAIKEASKNNQKE